MRDADPQALLGRLQALLGSGDNQQHLSKEARLQACQVARKIWLELEEPGDLADRMFYNTLENAMLEVATNLGIYKYLVDRDTNVSAQELAKATNCDAFLMTRILRTLAAFGQIDEVDVNSFAANKFSHTYITPKGIYSQRMSWDVANQVWANLPAWLKSIQYQNPTDPMHAGLQYAFNDDRHFFDFLVDRGLMENFQGYMSNYRTDRPEFLDVFQAEENLVPGSEENGIMLVDVGGGHGHDLEKFAAKFPQTKGRNILQDRPEVIADALVSDAFKATEYDFLTEQPVKGARGYYFRMIFHDWPDDTCLKILKHTAEAMKPGYSKLLINDIVLPDKGATRFACQSDIAMMGLLAAVERSESDWSELLGKAGLKIVKIWFGVPESVIEAEVA